MDNEEVQRRISQILKARIRRLRKRGEKMMRKDSLITYLVRLAQKIPFYISILLNAKSHYQNNLREAYLKAYKSFLGILQINELIIYAHWDAFKNKDLDPPFFLEF